MTRPVVTRSVATWLVKLYPPAWRSRYGLEFEAILASHRSSPAMLLDILAGALDARLHPQPHLQPSRQSSELASEDLMTVAMMKRCAIGGHNGSPEERKLAAQGTILASAVLAIVYMALTKAYHSATAVQAFGLASFPAVVLFYEQMAHLRPRPRVTRLLLVGGMTVLLYLFLWGVCVLAARI